jgi:hypothetical protein
MTSPLPLLLVGGGALLLLTGKKGGKKGSTGKAPAQTSPHAGSQNEDPIPTGEGSDNGTDPGTETPPQTGSEIPSESLPLAPLQGGDLGPYPPTSGEPGPDYPAPHWLPENGEGSQDSGLWMWRQTKLYDLGYRDEESKYAADGIPGEKTFASIKSFQIDWNWFADYLRDINPGIEYKSPYTASSTDSYWGQETESRVNKALSKLNGTDPIYVEELGRSVLTFRDMIIGLQQL